MKIKIRPAIAGKVAIVTGASSGIGEVAALEFASAGAKVVLTTFGRIDILANIAGAGYYDWFEELSSENLREHYEVNVIGLAELTREVLPTMKAQRSGYILNMCSYSSVISAPPLTVYASTKYAVEGLSDGLGVS